MLSLQQFRMDSNMTLLHPSTQLHNVHPRRKNNRNALHGMQAERMSLSEEAKLVNNYALTDEVFLCGQKFTVFYFAQSTRKAFSFCVLFEIVENISNLKNKYYEANGISWFLESSAT
jgi:predicted 2-oxoglutarate/Fe(II)-dependent dioxygenase YbiX